MDNNFVPSNETPRQKGHRHGALAVERIRAGVDPIYAIPPAPKSYISTELDSYYEGYFTGFAAARALTV